MALKREKILLIHWAPDPDQPVGACGEECEKTYLESRHKYYRHVYVTLSKSIVNCKKCVMALSLYELSKVSL